MNARLYSQKESQFHDYIMIIFYAGVIHLRELHAALVSNKCENSAVVFSCFVTVGF